MLPPDEIIFLLLTVSDISKVLINNAMLVLYLCKSCKVMKMKILIDFWFQWAPGWSNYASVIATLIDDSNFSCRIIVLPFHHSGQSDFDNKQAKQFLDERGISWINYTDYDYLTPKPDVVFVQNPYDFTRPERFNCQALHKNNIRFAYIPYGLDVGAGTRNQTFQYNMDCHNLATWLFVRSEQHKQFFKRYCDAGNRHVYVTGHPKFDAQKFWHKQSPHEKKTFLWTPHFVEGDIKGWSTFNIYYDAMIFMALNYPINLIIRPHPLFIGRLQAFGGEGVDKLSRLLDYAKTLENITLDFAASYDASFSHSDALIADAGSFLLEYLPTERPILYLTHDTCLSLNKSANFVFDSYYIARRVEDIDHFVNMVISGEDPLKNKRLKAMHHYLYKPEISAAEEIRKILTSYFSKRINKKTQIVGDASIHIDNDTILNFFESRAKNVAAKDLTLTLYQTPKLAIERDNQEKHLIIPQLKLMSQARVLDIGCGNGRWYGAIKDKIGFYVGIDFSPLLINAAKSHYHKNKTCQFYVASADKLTETAVINEPPFTHIIIAGVIMYLNDEQVIDLLHSLRSLVEPGTLIYLREPIASKQRLTLKQDWSAELNCYYSAIYRTGEEITELFSEKNLRLPLKLIKHDVMYDTPLNNRKETKQYYYIFEFL